MRPISGITAVILFLYVVAIFGATHLLAASFPDSRLSKAYIGLGF